MQVMGIFDRFPALATSLNPDYEGFKPGARVFMDQQMRAVKFDSDLSPTLGPY